MLRKSVVLVFIRFRVMTAASWGTAVRIAAKTQSYTKGFTKNKFLVSLCLGGISKESKNAGIKRNHQKVQ
jgi:hypothetical protein